MTGILLRIKDGYLHKLNGTASRQSVADMVIESTRDKNKQPDLSRSRQRGASEINGGVTIWCMDHFFNLTRARQRLPSPAATSFAVVLTTDF